MNESLRANRVSAADGFRWRSESASRLEGFTDGALGFTVSLLVLSLEVPKNFQQLWSLLRGIPAFAVTFALLVWIWHCHHLFFRRYGLNDVLTLILNSTLLFVILIYIYPLKFLYTLLLGAAEGTRADSMVPRHEDSVHLMALYSGGFCLIFALFVLLYFHAWRQRDRLELNARERCLTRLAMEFHGIFSCVGLVSMTMALVGGIRWVPAAGWIFALLGPLCFLHGWWRGRAAQDDSHQTQTSST